MNAGYAYKQTAEARRSTDAAIHVFMWRLIWFNSSMDRILDLNGYKSLRSNRTCNDRKGLHGFKWIYMCMNLVKSNARTCMIGKDSSGLICI